MDKISFVLPLKISGNKFGSDLNRVKKILLPSIRKYFNLKPDGNITKEMLISYINRDRYQTDISWVLYCWALNGFPDINIMLNKINQLAYQDTKQNNNTRIA